MRASRDASAELCEMALVNALEEEDEQERGQLEVMVALGSIPK